MAVPILLYGSDIWTLTKNYRKVLRMKRSNSFLFIARIYGCTQKISFLYQGKIKFKKHLKSTTNIYFCIKVLIFLYNFHHFQIFWYLGNSFFISASCQSAVKFWNQLSIFITSSSSLAKCQLPRWCLSSRNRWSLGTESGEYRGCLKNSY